MAIWRRISPVQLHFQRNATGKAMAELDMKFGHGLLPHLCTMPPRHRRFVHEQGPHGTRRSTSQTMRCSLRLTSLRKNARGAYKTSKSSPQSRRSFPAFHFIHSSPAPLRSFCNCVIARNHVLMTHACRASKHLSVSQVRTVPRMYNILQTPPPFHSLSVLGLVNNSVIASGSQIDHKFGEAAN